MQWERVGLGHRKGAHLNPDLHRGDAGGGGVFLEANKKCVTHSDLGSAACRLPAGAGVGTVAEMVVEGVEYVIRLASRAGAT